MVREAETTGETAAEVRAAEVRQAQALAARCRLQYVDLEHFQPDHDLFRSVPVELMFRYNFLPYRREDDNLVVVTSDPTNVPAPRGLDPREAPREEEGGGERFPADGPADPARPILLLVDPPIYNALPKRASDIH